MRDFIITLFLFAVLVAAFSFGDFEPQEQQNANMFLPVESGKQTGQQPTEGTGGTEPVSPKIEPKATDKPMEQPVSEPSKSIDELAWEVIIGLWSEGSERKRLLTDAGHDYDAVQRRVNELLTPKEVYVNGFRSN